MLVFVMLFAMVIGTTLTTSAATYSIQRQLETKWKNYYYGGGNLYNTGCGIFSLVNAVGYLTGNSMSITEVASWAHSINAFNVNGGDGTYRLVLYPKVQARYGETYGFTLDCNNGQGWWAGSSSSLLKQHLANGGVAVGHVPGHFIALVGYDYNTNKFHVYDSAPSTARGTNSYGDTGLGDCWVTQDRLATGKLKLDWFCLLSASGGVSAEYMALEELIKSTLHLKIVDYTASEATAIRDAYTNAVSVLNNDASTDNDYKSAYNTLYAAIHPTANILSIGKYYTATTPTRTDKFADNGVRLTDGNKGDINGGNDYSGWQGSCEVLVDLGSAMNSNTYTVYFAAGTWGISTPKDIVDVTVSYSVSGGTYTKLDNSSAAVLKYGTGVADEETMGWSTYELTFSTKTVNARYIKFEFVHSGGGHIWIDEVEVAKYDEVFLSDKLYINGVNSRIQAGDCKVFTPAFGTITTEAANHAWTCNVIAKWDESQGGYVIKSVSNGIGADTPSITLASDEILIAAHNWEGSGASDTVPGSALNTEKLQNMKAGDLIQLSNVTVSLGYYDVLAYATLSSAECDHVYTATVVAPTCDDQGYTLHKCSLCGDEYKDTFVPAKHTEGDWVTLSDGSKELRCEKCGELLDSEEAPAYALGDVNADGVIDMFDYLMVKSFYFEITVPTADEFRRADCNADGAIDMFDYLLVKTAYFNS